jgi:hypothetical protein
VEINLDYEMLEAAVRDYSRAIRLDSNLYAAYVGVDESVG